MNSITASTLAKSVLENRLLSSLLALLVWIAGVMSGSALVMVVCGLLVYARPFLYIALLNMKAKTEQTAKTRLGKLSSIRFTQAQSTYMGTWDSGRDYPDRLR